MAWEGAAAVRVAGTLLNRAHGTVPVAMVPSVVIDMEPAHVERSVSSLVPCVCADGAHVAGCPVSRAHGTVPLAMVPRVVMFPEPGHVEIAVFSTLPRPTFPLLMVSQAGSVYDWSENRNVAGL